MRTIVVFTHPSGEEALYVDGKLAKQDTTIYATDIDEFAFSGSIPVLFSHFSTADFDGEWPEDVDDVPTESESW